MHGEAVPAEEIAEDAGVLDTGVLKNEKVHLISTLLQMVLKVSGTAGRRTLAAQTRLRERRRLSHRQCKAARKLA
jgi:hypothetical protein